MMSLDTIRSMSRDAGIEAAQNAVEPKTFWAEDVFAIQGGEISALRAIPNLGDHIPAGWTEVCDYFVDSSGFGQDDEPALTIAQFADVLEPDFGYAITSAGQFQITIAKFKRD